MPRWLDALAFISGLSVIGAVAGTFIGLSKSPVVGAVLPLVFALIAGTGGLYLPKAPGSKLSPLALTGLGLLAFGTATGACALHGLMMRTDEGWAWVVRPFTADAPGAALTALSGPDAAAVLVVERQLAMLGVGRSARETVVHKLASGGSCDATATSSTDVRLVKNAEALEKELSAWRQSWTPDTSASKRQLQSLHDSLTTTRRTISEGAPCSSARGAAIRQLAVAVGALRLDDPEMVKFL